MPELPEVETTLRGVAPHVLTRRIVALQVYDHRLRWPVPADLPKKVVGRTIDAAERRAKYLLFRFGSDALLVHLGMTGSLRIHREPPPRRPHDHVDLVFADSTVLRYHDPRRFGAVLWVEAPVFGHPLLANLGPEPLSADFDADYLYGAIRRRSTPVKSAIMDNHLVVGVGNIYANEALFRAGIRPGRPVGRISRALAGRLVDTVREVLAEAIAAGGSTLRDYVDSAGEPGHFQLSYYVYGREKLPCRVCSTPIRVRRLGGRASFWCPGCQK